eukprot:211391-Pelagomonas_calceolata.AAC.1
MQISGAAADGQTFMEDATIQLVKISFQSLDLLLKIALDWTQDDQIGNGMIKHCPDGTAL